jgi:mRNA interferase MazF
MARFVKGDVVVVPFPFSDLSRAKRRPALVLASTRGGDLILCQITSRAVTDGYAVALDESDFRSGSLRKPSNVRPNRLSQPTEASFFTAPDNWQQTKPPRLLTRSSLS